MVRRPSLLSAVLIAVISIHSSTAHSSDLLGGLLRASQENDEQSALFASEEDVTFEFSALGGEGHADAEANDARPVSYGEPAKQPAEKIAPKPKKQPPKPNPCTTSHKGVY